MWNEFLYKYFPWSHSCTTRARACVCVLCVCLCLCISMYGDFVVVQESSVSVCVVCSVGWVQWLLLPLFPVKSFPSENWSLGTSILACQGFPSFVGNCLAIISQGCFLRSLLPSLHKAEEACEKCSWNYHSLWQNFPAEQPVTRTYSKSSHMYSCTYNRGVGFVDPLLVQLYPRNCGTFSKGNTSIHCSAVHLHQKALLLV